MTSELAYTAIRFGYFILLWVFVFAALGILKRDIFGTVVTSRGRGRRAAAPPAKKRRKSKKSKDTPTRQPRYLVVTGGPLTGTTLPLGDSPVIIGRAPSCTLVLDDTYASGQHARLYKDNDDQWFLEDMNSTNGTFVDGERMGPPREIGMGIQIRIGQTTMELSR